MSHLPQKEIQKLWNDQEALGAIADKYDGRVKVDGFNA